MIRLMSQVADAGDSAVETFAICIVALLFRKFGRSGILKMLTFILRA